MNEELGTVVQTLTNGDRLMGHAVVAREGGVFALEEIVTEPLQATHIGIKTRWSGISFGTELALLRKRLNWGPFPLVTGYMGVGTVSHVGSEVSGFCVGDRVYFRRNGQLTVAASGEPVSSVSGVHSSVAVLDPSGNFGADHVPANVPDDIASTFVLPSVGLNGVDEAGVGVGDSVVVIGAGMIGLAVIAAAVARGARVMAIDVRAAPLQVAHDLGAHHVLLRTELTDVDSEVKRVFGADGVDCVFEATGRPESIDTGIRLCRPHGCFVWQGNYGLGPISFEFQEAHSRMLRMVFPCDDGYRPARRAVMTSLENGWLKWELTMTDRVDAKSAPAFFARVLAEGMGDTLGAAIDWSDC